MLFLTSIAFSQKPFFKRIKTNNVDIALFSDGTWQYISNYDHSNVLDTSLYENPPISFSGCKKIICSYTNSKKEYTRIIPFLQKDVIENKTSQEYQLEYYKESSADSFLQVRMKLFGKSVSILFSGIAFDILSIDTSRSIYLLKVFHSNGLQTWYYPVYNIEKNLNVSKPGGLLGSTFGECFFEIRYKNRTFAVETFIDKNNNIKPNPIFINNKDFIDNNSLSRETGFFNNVLKAKSYIENKYDFNKLLEQEIKKQ